MGQHTLIRVYLAKVLAFFLRLALSLRYDVKVEGTEVLMGNRPHFLLPNHQALIDPVILLAHLYKHTTAIPVLTSDFYDMPFLKPFFSGWGAVRVSNLEGKSRNTNVLNEISSAVVAGFSQNRNILLYPGGQLAAQGFERIVNKKSAHLIVTNMPSDVRVIAIRISGLWGSIWSKAWTGKTPGFVWQLFRGMFYVWANFVFFMPRRKVSIHIEDVTLQAIDRAQSGRPQFNGFLERFYNQHGEEPVLFLKHYFYGRKPRRTLPPNLKGAIPQHMAGSGMHV
ncbi:MAG: 1-acyl-sn-glycerol-3-phosphate acyltransferase [Breznakibacter sp.]